MGAVVGVSVIAVTGLKVGRIFSIWKGQTYMEQH